jgi:AcrR family transcriptional regulator
MKAALSLILTEGIDKVSWRRIARAVDFSPAGLYEHFDDKDAIVTAIADEGLALLDQALRTVPQSSPLEERLVGLGLAYIAFARAHPGHFHLVFAMLPSRRHTTQQPATGAYAQVRDALQRGVDTGRIAPRATLDVEGLAYGFWGLAHGLAALQLTHLRGFDADFERADREVLACFVRGMTG